MPTDGMVGIAITATTAQAPQDERFGSWLKWVLLQNDTPTAITVLGDGEAVLAHLWPGDVKLINFGRRNYNSIRFYGDAVSTAGDITANNILWIEFEYKRREGP